jgi:hypothetical protein
LIARHRVEVTGIIEKPDSGLVMKAKGLKMVAESCSQ